MLACEGPELTASKRLRCDGIDLCNRMDLADWRDEERVQVLLCEDCWQPGCAVGGYVRVSRLGSYVLWTPGRFDPADEFDANEYRPAEFLKQTGAIVIATDAWKVLRRRVRGLPRAREFPPAERIDLRAAWDLEAPREWSVIAARDSEPAEAVRRIDAVVAWLAADAHSEVSGDLIRVPDADVEDVYVDVPDRFDRPVLNEWRPYARRDRHLSPAFRGNWTLTPAPIDESEALTA